MMEIPFKTSTFVSQDDRKLAFEALRDRAVDSANTHPRLFVVSWPNKAVFIEKGTLGVVNPFFSFLVVYRPTGENQPITYRIGINPMLIIGLVLILVLKVAPIGWSWTEFTLALGALTIPSIVTFAISARSLKQTALSWLESPD